MSPRNQKMSFLAAMFVLLILCPSFVFLSSHQICKTSTCTCSPDHVRVNCTSAGLPSMPHTLHPMIEQLILANNSIKQLGIYGELTIAPNLKVLDLSYNKFERISKDPFSSQRLLKSLNLDGNLLSPPGGDFFKGLIQLENLHLARNSFGPEILAATFSDLKSLKYLNLSHNNIVALSNNSLSNLKSLQILSLRDNDLGRDISTLNIPSSVISNLNRFQNGRPMYEMTVLDIAGLRSHILSNLQKLDLGQNTFTLILSNNSPFSKQNQVRVDYNQEKNLNNNQDRNQDNDLIWDSLEELNLDHCNIEFIEENSLNALSSLSILKLNNNRLTTIKMSTFSENTNLKILDLSFNNLFTIESGILSSSSLLSPSSSSLHFANLLILNLSSNNLSTIDESLVPASLLSPEIKNQDKNKDNNQDEEESRLQSSIFPPSTILDISNNPLNCDCSLNPLRVYLIERALYHRNVIETQSTTSSVPLAGKLTSNEVNPVLEPESSSSKPVESSSQFNLDSEPQIVDLFIFQDLNQIRCFKIQESNVTFTTSNVTYVKLSDLDPIGDLFCDNEVNKQNKKKKNFEVKNSFQEFFYSSNSNFKFYLLFILSLLLILISATLVILYIHHPRYKSRSNDKVTNRLNFMNSSKNRPLPAPPVARSDIKIRKKWWKPKWFPSISWFSRSHVTSKNLFEYHSGSSVASCNSARRPNTLISITDQQIPDVWKFPASSTLKPFHPHHHNYHPSSYANTISRGNLTTIAKAKNNLSCHQVAANSNPHLTTALLTANNVNTTTMIPNNERTMIVSSSYHEYESGDKTDYEDNYQDNYYHTLGPDERLRLNFGNQALISDLSSPFTIDVTPNNSLSPHLHHSNQHFRSNHDQRSGYY